MIHPISAAPPDATALEPLVHRVLSGEEQLRESLIRQAMPFIRNIVSQHLARRDVDGTEEFSVALMAFDESIDAFRDRTPGRFEGFAATVIRRRLKDLGRRQRRRDGTLLFSDMTPETGPDAETRVSMVRPTETVQDQLEFMESVQELEECLSGFGLRLEQLHRVTPKHADTRRMCVTLARRILEDPDLRRFVFDRRQLPVRDLAEQTGRHRKTVEKHRKFILCLVLLLNSRLDQIKYYIRRFMDTPAPEQASAGTPEREGIPNEG